MIPLLVVVGPTASGKTELGLRLAAEFDGEIVNADSVQIYRHFDIGSAKPSPSELAQVPHHLVGELEPLDEIEASRFLSLADQAISAIVGRGRQPIVCGGSFLWVRALLFGLADAPAADPALRQRHFEWAERDGRAALHTELLRLDPASAARLHPNDFVRVSRALEVLELSGKRLSEVQSEHGFQRPRYAFQLVGRAWTRPDHDARIEERVRSMLAAGFREEVERLLSAGYADARAIQAVGYRQMKEAVLAGAAVDESLIAEICRATRIFARRQRTWLREQPVDWLPGTPDEAAAAWPSWLARRSEFLTSERE